jgi:N-acetyl-gamma-glutamyl-phosphate reductase
MIPGQGERIGAARKVANPGCYPTGAIGLIRPLVEAGLIPRDYPIAINAVSGYSGGGRGMIEAHDRDGGPAFELYALGLEHKHVPETQLYAGLSRRPIFVPSVGHFRQGMLVSVPLHLDTLPGRPRGADLHDALAAFYQGCDHVRVVEPASGAKLEPEALNDTTRSELRVCTRAPQAVWWRGSTIWQGASGAAVQNLSLMLGLRLRTRDEELRSPAQLSCRARRSIWPVGAPSADLLRSQ